MGETCPKCKKEAVRAYNIDRYKRKKVNGKQVRTAQIVKTVLYFIHDTPTGTKWCCIGEVKRL